MSRDDDLWRKAGQTIRNQSSEITTLKAERSAAIAERDEIARMRKADRGTWPNGAEYVYGESVEKFTGEARWCGTILSAYITSKGTLRYVVEVEPQGFQMIATPNQLRRPSKVWSHT